MRKGECLNGTWCRGNDNAGKIREIKREQVRRRREEWCEWCLDRARITRSDDFDGKVVCVYLCARDEELGQ